MYDNYSDYTKNDGDHVGEHDFAAEFFASEAWPNNREDDAENKSKDKLGGVRDGRTERGDAENEAVAVGEFGTGADALIDEDAGQVDFFVMLHDVSVATME